MKHTIIVELKRAGNNFNSLKLIQLLGKLPSLDLEKVKPLVTNLKNHEIVKLALHHEDEWFSIQDELNLLQIEVLKMTNIQLEFNEEDVNNSISDIMMNITEYEIVDNLLMHKPTNAVVLLEIDEAFKRVKAAIDQRKQ